MGGVHLSGSPPFSELSGDSMAPIARGQRSFMGITGLAYPKYSPRGRVINLVGLIDITPAEKRGERCAQLRGAKEGQSWGTGVERKVWLVKGLEEGISGMRGPQTGNLE